MNAVVAPQQTPPPVVSDAQPAPVSETVAANAPQTTDQLDALIARVKKAQREYAKFTQQQVDAIFREAAMAANQVRIELAKDAVAETRMGIVEDKVIKNHFASEFVFNKYKNVKTCGVLEQDHALGMTKVAEPIGVIAGVVPTTNPTSTAIFKALLALKTRNGIIFSPHPRAKQCTVKAARIVLEAAVRAGAPKDIIAWIAEPSVELSQRLMQHSDINLILATGGPNMVHAAYSSGKPALGVGAGNTPVIIDESADIKMAVNSIILSKTFDNGVVCASEQALVVCQAVYDEVVATLKARDAYFVEGEEREKLAETVMPKGYLNPNVVGQSARTIAEMAGLKVPDKTKVLIARAEKIGAEEPFSAEKLSPVLALYKVANFEAAVETASKLVRYGGRGHTSVLYVCPAHTEKIEAFQKRMETGRTLVNMPASQGAIGDVFNFSLTPSLTLGCGSWGGNSSSENVGVTHLLNIKSVVERRENLQWFKVPPKIYFKPGALRYALPELKGLKRAFIVTSKELMDLNMCRPVIDILEELGMTVQVNAEIKPDPTLSAVQDIVRQLQSFQPDAIIAVGGGSPIDAAKILWLLYEAPDTPFEDLAMRFMDIRKRIVAFPTLGKKSTLVAIPTTSGTGSEVTPFSVITDDRTGIKYPLADYELTPDMAIIDPEFVMTMPRGLTVASGLDALTHAIEAYTSVLATPFTNGLALEAIGLIFENLKLSANDPRNHPEARENMHYAASIAGMAFANAFLGVCHSMAHTLGGVFHMPHGIANAMLISQVIRYNATDDPTKQAAFSQYKYPDIKARFAKIADYLQLGGTTPDEKVDRLIAAIEQLKAELDVPLSMKDYGISEQSYMEALDVMAERAFDDQCTPGNPRYPLMNEIREIYLHAYHGRTKF